MDFDISTFIITKDQEYIPADEYDGMVNGEGVFVALTNDFLNQDSGDDNSICIHRDWRDVLDKTRNRLSHIIRFGTGYDNQVSCPWQTEEKEIPGIFKVNSRTDTLGIYNTKFMENALIKYLDGPRTNRETIRNANSLLNGRSIEEYLPAFMVSFHTTVEFDGRILHGYLPAIGQLLFINNNIDTINTALMKIDTHIRTFKTHRHNMSDFWWSATEYDAGGAWGLGFGSTDDTGKIDPYLVLPLFKI